MTIISNLGGKPNNPDVFNHFMCVIFIQFFHLRLCNEIIFVSIFEADSKNPGYFLTILGILNSFLEKAQISKAECIKQILYMISLPQPDQLSDNNTIYEDEVR